MLFAIRDDDYRSDSIDLSGQTDSIENIPRERLVFLLAFLRQIAELTDLDSTGMLPEYMIRHLILTQIIRPGESAAHIVELLARYRDEWFEIAEKGMNKGQTWPRYLIPTMKGRNNVSRLKSIRAMFGKRLAEARKAGEDARGHRRHSRL